MTSASDLSRDPLSDSPLAPERNRQRGPRRPPGSGGIPPERKDRILGTGQDGDVELIHRYGPRLDHRPGLLRRGLGRKVDHRHQVLPTIRGRVETTVRLTVIGLGHRRRDPLGPRAADA